MSQELVSNDVALVDKNTDLAEAQISHANQLSHSSHTLRKTDIDSIGNMPWGTHFCQFYQTKQDLIDILVPYLKAGLENNEFCMWVTADNLNCSEAEQALRASMPDFDRYLESGAIVILPYTEWYLDGGEFDRHRVLNSWIEKLHQSLAMGFDGVRVTGDTMWLNKSHWQDFTEYEESINTVIGDYPLLVMCTYSLDKCSASEIIDVIANHEFAVMKRSGAWTIIESADSKQTKEALRKTLLELETVKEDLQCRNDELRVSNNELQHEAKYRRKAEEELHKLNRTLKAHNRSDRAMIQAIGESEYLHEVCKIIAEDCGHAMVWVGFALDDEAKTVRPVAQAGFEAGYLDTLNVTWSDTERGYGPTGTAIRTGKPTICRDMRTDPKFTPWREEALKRGYASSIVLPLMTDDKAFGAITIYSQEPDPFSDNEVALLTELTNDVAYGIRTIRLRIAHAQAEEALRRSEERYRALVDLSPQAIYVHRNNGVEFVNPSALKLFGATSADQILGKSPFDLFHPDYHAVIQERLSALHEGLPARLMEEKIIRMDGSVRDVEVTASPFFDSDGLAIQVMLNDITERKLAEQTLKVKDSAISSAINPIVIADLQGNLTYVNSASLSLWGYKNENEVLGNSALGFVAEPRRAIEVMQAIRDGGSWEGEIAAIREDGTRLSLHLAASTVLDDSGSPICMMASFLDLTERKHSEDALRKSEQQFRIMGETVPYGVWLCGPDGGVRYASQSFLDLIDMTQEEQQQFGWTKRLVPEDVEPMMNAWLKCCSTGTLWEHEHRIVDRNGDIHTILSKGLPVRDDDGNITCWVGVNLDITERKRQEVQLAQARIEADQKAAQLESFIASMTHGVALFDAEGNTVFLNEAGRTILGAEHGKTFAEWGQNYHRVALDGTPLHLEESPSSRALRGETVRDFRYKIVLPDKEKIISISASPVLDPHKQVIGATNIFEDITDIAAFERQREELLERESNIARVLQQAIVPQNVPSKLLGYGIAVRYKPALKEAEIGGDFYDIFELDGGKLGILIGDIAGKGLPAAIQVAAARHTIRSYAYIESEPGNVLALANEALCRDNGLDEINMLTALYAVADTNAGNMTYASAGHEPPIICGPSGMCEELQYGGIPMSVMPGVTYPQFTLRIAPGDTIIMVTDGITEARAQGTEFFGRERVHEVLIDSLHASPDEIAVALMDAATAYAGGRLHDDAAIVAVRYEDGLL